MKAPIIGIAAAYEKATWGFWSQPAAIVSGTYINKVTKAGGVPIGLIPTEAVAENLEDVIHRLDGLLLIGGMDLDPTKYGQEPDRRLEATAPERDEFELALTSATFKANVPVLGICRGLQIMNVANGGTLHQHLLDVGYGEHRAAPGSLGDETYHGVDITDNTLAASAVGAGQQRVNSHHHQGLDTIGFGAVVTAKSSEDGLPEALEWPDQRYALGVQWHPEAMELEGTITTFVEAARNYANEKESA